MSGLTFAFSKKLTGETKSGGGSFAKLGHAYIAEITEVTESPDGRFVNVNIKGVNYDAGTYDSFSFFKEGKFTIEQIQKLANNVIASNDSMKGAVGQDSINLAKWSNAGLQIGVVYGIKQEKNDAGAYVDSKWIQPKFSLPVDQVEEWTPDMVAYEAHRKAFWSDGATPAPIATDSQAPVVEDEGLDLLF